MASTTTTHNDKATTPDLSTLNINDDVTISGVHASIARGRSYIRDAKAGNGKAFTLKVAGGKSINIKRTK